jgi:RNA polymerase sigma factor (TIGR02999 family)
LQATAVVHEAYMRLIDQSRVDWKSRAHFFAVAAEMIRRVLVDYARRRGAAKRGGRVHQVALTDAAGADDPEHVDLLDLDDALQELERLNDRHRRVVELRFFGGLSVEETAHVLDVSPQTVRADWRMARAWLKHRLNQQS